MSRKTKFVDLPVYPSTRDLIKNKKGHKSYDEFIREILDIEIGL